MESVDLLPLAVGVFFLLGGWLLYWVSLNVVGAVLSAGLALTAAQFFIDAFELTDMQVFGIRAAAVIAGGVAGVFFFRFVHSAAFFILGAFGAASGTLAIMNVLPPDTEPEWLLSDLAKVGAAALASLIGGFFALKMSRYLLIAISSFAGAYLIVVGAHWPREVIPLAPIAAVGLAVQLGVIRPWKNRAKWEEDEEEG